MKTFESVVTMDNFDYLSEVFNDYCIKHNLPLDMSAEDILYENKYSNLIDLTEDQIQWLKRFIKFSFLNDMGTLTN